MEEGEIETRDGERKDGWGDTEGAMERGKRTEGKEAIREGESADWE
jgi:hypothetical protein